MPHHNILEATEQATVDRPRLGMAKPEFLQITRDCAAIGVGPGFHERASCPGISKAIARKSSVASFRYGIVASAERWPNRSPITFRGTDARRRVTARACRKAWGPHLPHGFTPAASSRRRISL